MAAAAFGRLCVETNRLEQRKLLFLQPPSGGCVLKPPYVQKLSELRHAAAFGRLCVETDQATKLTEISRAAAFGRLCVET